MRACLGGNYNHSWWDWVLVPVDVDAAPVHGAFRSDGHYLGQKSEEAEKI